MKDRQVQSLPLEVFDVLLRLFLFLESIFSGVDVMTGGRAWREGKDQTNEGGVNIVKSIPYYSFPFSFPQGDEGIPFADIKAQLAMESKSKKPKNKFLSTVDAALDATFWSSFRLSEFAKASTSSSNVTRLENLRQKCEDAAEIVRIIRYYAEEPMVATEPGQVQGTRKLEDHFRDIAARGGELKEIDKMTTTAGALELLVSGKLLQGEAGNSTIAGQVTVVEENSDADKHIRGPNERLQETSL